MPLTVGETGHPVARALDVADVSAVAVPATQLPRDATVIGRAGAAPAIVASEQDGRRVVDVYLQLRGSTLPFSVGFPVLMANATDWVAARDRNASEIVAGEPLHWIISKAARASDVCVIGPDGGALAAATQNGR